MSHVPIRKTLPAIDGSPEGHFGGPSSDRKGPQRASAPVETKRIAHLAAAVIDAWGGCDAVAEFLDVDRSLVIRWRTGEKSMPLRYLVMLFEGCADAFIAFATPICIELKLHPPRPQPGPSFAQLAGAVLADLDDGSTITRRLIENAAQKRGWSAEQVALALRKEDET